MIVYQSLVLLIRFSFMSSFLINTRRYLSKSPKIIRFESRCLCSQIRVQSDAFNSSIDSPYHSLLRDRNVLIVGDGDFSFAASIARSKVCSSLIATTLDSHDLLTYSYSNASRHIQEIITNGASVHYEVNALYLDSKYANRKFDRVVWNFPHIAGKQNIKYNRQLIQDFFKTSQRVLTDNGSIIITLCKDQSGYDAKTDEEWNYSWKLTAQIGEAMLLLTQRFNFDPLLVQGYTPAGHRGHGGSFLIGGSKIYVIQAPSRCPSLGLQGYTMTSVNNISNCSDLLRHDQSLDQNITPHTAITPVAGSVQDKADSGLSDAIIGLQSSFYLHEVHLLHNTIYSDYFAFELKVQQIARQISEEYNFSEALWCVDLVDVYQSPNSCPGVSHAFQIGYYSYSMPISRCLADEFRLIIESELPKRLELRLRPGKHHGRVSKCYPDYVAQALHQDRSRLSIQTDLDEGISESSNQWDESDKNNQINTLDDNTSTDLMTNSNVTDCESRDVDTEAIRIRNFIRAAARALWPRRAGVLLHQGALETSIPSN